MSRYAEGTTVPVERTRAEIEATLSRFGATEFGYVTRPKGAVIEFLVRGRRVRFVLPLADRNDPKFTRTPQRGHRRSGVASGKAWDGDCRQRWRTLALCIKAKLAAVTEGIVEFDREFMPHIVDPVTGATMAELVLPAIADRYEGIANNAGGLLCLPAPEDT